MLIGDKTIALKESIENKIDAEQRVDLDNNAWVVDFDGTNRELSYLLGAKNGELGNFVILEATSVSGFGHKRIGDWIKQHVEDRNRE